MVSELQLVAVGIKSQPYPHHPRSTEGYQDLECLALGRLVTLGTTYVRLPLTGRPDDKKQG